MKNFVLLLRANTNMSAEAFFDSKEIKLRAEWLEEIKNNNIIVNLGGTMPPSPFMAATIFSDGSVTEGAFSEIDHFITGYLVIKAENLEYAKEVARSNPILKVGGSIEIREIMLR